MTTIRSAFAVACVATLVPTAYAANITKSFEFGPGTQYSSSVFRTFEIPSGLEVAAVIKYRRLGTGNQGIPIEIELREPETSPGVEGAVAEIRSASATTVEKGITLHSLASNRGCSKPWRVRVRYAGTGSMPNAVFGTAKMDYDGRVRSITTSSPGYVSKKTVKEVNVGGPEGLDQGTIGVTANWNHMIFAVPGPSPVKFRVFLVSYPDVAPGTQFIHRSTEAYSSNEANATPKFGMSYKVLERARGQFALIFENEDVHDAFVGTPTVNFTPTCN